MAERPPKYLLQQELPVAQRLALAPSIEDLQQRLADFIRLASDILLESDRHLTLTYVSARCADVLGYHPWEMVGRSILSFGHFVDNDTERTPPDWRHPFRNLEFQATARDGAARYLLLSALPVFDPETETFIGVRASVEDRTRHKADEERLHKLSQAVEQSPGSVIITDRNGVIEYVNRRFVECYGYSAEEVLGRTPSIVSSGRMPRSVYREMWTQLQAGEEWRGELYNHKKNGEGIWEYTVISPIFDDHGHITNYIAAKEDVTERKRIEDELLKRGYADETTGLPNRTLAFDRLEQAIARVRRQDGIGALLMIDLDHFKRINDVVGHLAADTILREVGQRLLTLVRPDDTVARIGGDEFCIVVCECHMDDVESLTQRLIRSFTQPLVSTGQELYVSPSVGVAIFPNDGANAADLMRNAHTAAHRVKELGGNGFQFFTPDMNAGARERSRLESALHHALERNELEMHYQAMMDISTGRIVGAEALMRWNSPEFGRVPPDRFIPLAENSNLIVRLGTWALESASRQAALWVREFGPRFRMAVNISAAQVRKPGFADLVFRTVDGAAIARENLELEITERLLMDGNKGVGELARLHEAGVYLSVDDFGTGYSSLSYLKRFPIGTLKIDRSFIRDLAGGGTDRTLVTAIIAMAHSLGIDVVAEGVETLKQLEVLRSLGCNVAQGYLFGAPVPPATFVDALPANAVLSSAAN